jgi:glutaredoxin
MIEPGSRPVLTVYRRAGCHLCDDARDLIQAVLEERVRRGELVPAVREVDIEADPELHARYLEMIPVLSLGGAEVSLVTNARQVRLLLDRAMPRLA